MSSSPRRNPLSHKAEPAPTPVKPAVTKIDQAGWAGAKRRVALPNGITIAYVEMGNPEGRPVLLVHGYTDSSRSWSLPAAQLAHRYRLIAVDLRGHGASSAPECCYTIPDMVHDLRLLLDHLEDRKGGLRRPFARQHDRTGLRPAASRSLAQAGARRVPPCPPPRRPRRDHGCPTMS